MDDNRTASEVILNIVNNIHRYRLMWWN